MSEVTSGNVLTGTVSKDVIVKGTVNVSHPVKGKDYFTEADKAEIVAEVLAQMPETGNAADEWIVIADVTTTEEVFNFVLTTDINGNPFNCKRIIADATFPNGGLGSNVPVYFGYHTNQWSANFAHNISDTSVRRYLMDGELIPNYGAIMRLYENGSNEYFNSKKMASGIFRKFDNESLSAFWFSRGSSSEKFPVGTQLKVWGLKK